MSKDGLIAVCVMLAFIVVFLLWIDNRVTNDNIQKFKTKAHQLEAKMVAFEKLQVDVATIHHHLNLSQQSSTKTQTRKQDVANLKNAIKNDNDGLLTQECDALYQDVFKRFQTEKVSSIKVFAQHDTYRANHFDDLGKCLQSYGFNAKVIHEYYMACLQVSL